MDILSKQKVNRYLSVLLLVIFALVLLYGTFLNATPSLNNKIHNAKSTPFSFSDIASQVTDCILISALRQVIEDRPNRGVSDLRLLDFWKQNKTTINSFKLFFVKYLLEFLSIILFVIIIIFWKNKKDGKKDDLKFLDNLIMLLH